MIYIYLCEKKHGEFEIEHGMDEKLEFCPKCQEENLGDQPIKRLIAGGTTFTLKGGGWASEGYK